MNPLEILLKEMNHSGISCDITRKNDGGVLEKVKESEIKTLTTKSQIATTAHLLARLNKEEKLEWALETKNEGNELYERQEYLQAMEKYVECLAATDFGTSKPITTDQLNSTEGASSKTDNVEELVLPVLCNLAACCIQLKQWEKAVLFCQQVLQLRPKMVKALYRQGMAYVHCGEYNLAIETFQHLIKELKEKKEWETEGLENQEKRKAEDEVGEIANDSSAHQRNMNQLNAREKKNLLIYITKAKQGLQKEKESHLKQREAMKKAFQSRSEKQSPKETAIAEEGDSNTRGDEPHGIRLWFLRILNFVLKKLLYCVVIILQLVLRFLRIFIRQDKPKKE